VAPTMTRDEDPRSASAASRIWANRSSVYRVESAFIPLLLASLLSLTLTGCTPTVKIEAPDKPIVINLNVKIEQEVRVKVDRDVDSLVQSNPALF